MRKDKDYFRFCFVLFCFSFLSFFFGNGVMWHYVVKCTSRPAPHTSRTSFLQFISLNIPEAGKDGKTSEQNTDYLFLGGICNSILSSSIY